MSSAGHTDTIFDCEISPQSANVFCTCSYDTTVKVPLKIPLTEISSYSTGVDLECNWSQFEENYAWGRRYCVQVYPKLNEHFSFSQVAHGHQAQRELLPVLFLELYWSLMWKQPELLQSFLIMRRFPFLETHLISFPLSPPIVWSGIPNMKTKSWVRVQIVSQCLAIFPSPLFFLLLRQCCCHHTWYESVGWSSLSRKCGNWLIPLNLYPDSQRT